MSKTKQVNTNKNEDIHQALARIQRDLKSPKLQHNDFANFDYRSCEDILEAVKPLLNGYHLIINDIIFRVGERYYVRARATLSNGTESIYGEAVAREAEFKKGMDPAQITGATSSYARKYALNGLLAIDDTRDVDLQKVSKSSSGEKMVRTLFNKMKKELKQDNVEAWEKKIQNAKGLTGNNRILLQRKLEQLKKEL